MKGAAAKRNAVRILRRITAPMVIALVLASCGPDRNPGLGEAGFVPALYVQGDVEAPLRVDRSNSADFEWTTIDDGGTRRPAIALSELIGVAGPRANDYALLLAGSDGLASRIDGADLGGCFVAFSEVFSWECVNFNHPISSRVKMLQRILVATKEGALDPHALGIADASGDRAVTVGQLQMGPLMSQRRLEGRSEIDGRYVEVYTPHLFAPLADLLGASGTTLVAGYDGTMKYVQGNPRSAIEVRENVLHYAQVDKPVVEDIAGLMADPPLNSIAAVYSDSNHFLQAAERVLIIELDGWGWQMYENAKAQGKQTALSELGAIRAMAAFPPISPVGLATMLTGVQPNEHGIHDREGKQLAVPDLFEGVGGHGAYVEGDTALIRTSLAPTLSPDLGGIEGTDDEVHANALKAVRSDAQLVFVHYHGIDDLATTYGPYAEETLDRMALIDSYVSELLSAWAGRAIITADHGLHEVQGGGSHGVFCTQDMVVPYILTRGGLMP